MKEGADNSKFKVFHCAVFLLLLLLIIYFYSLFYVKDFELSLIISCSIQIKFIIISRLISISFCYWYGGAVHILYVYEHIDNIYTTQLISQM